MGRKHDVKPVMGIEACDPAQVRMSFLAMRTRIAQALSRADKAIREARKVESHVHLLTIKMEMSRSSLAQLQGDIEALLKGLEDARRAELRRRN